MLNVTVLCFTFVSTQQRVTWPQMLPSLVMFHNTFWDDCASGLNFLTRRRTLDKRLKISYLIEVGKHVCTCTSTHSPSSARSLSPSNRPQDVFQERRLNGDAPMVSLVQPAGLDFLRGCSLAQLCIWKLYMPYGYFEFEEVYAGIHWSNFRRVIREISPLRFCWKQLLEFLWTRPVGFILNLQQLLDIQRWCTHRYQRRLKISFSQWGMLSLAGL